MPPRKPVPPAAPPRIKPLIPSYVRYLGRERSGPHTLEDGRHWTFHPGRPIVVDRESWPLLRELPAVAELIRERIILETP